MQGKRYKTYKNETADIIQLRVSYIEIGKLLQKYGHGQFDGVLSTLMSQIKCIDSDERVEDKMEYLAANYGNLFAPRGGLGEFIIYDADDTLRNQLNEKYSAEVKIIWNILKEYL